MGQRVPILTYHKISPVHPKSIYPGTFVPPGLFRKQMAFLKREGFNAVTLSELDFQSDPKHVVLTFDDGFQDFADTAFPILEEFGFKATVFLVADQLGKTNAWDERIGDVSAPLMSASTIRQLASRGIEFGAHTLSHPHLPGLTPDEQFREVIDSRLVLQRETDLPIRNFCYPYGAFDPDTLRAVQEAGYNRCTTTKKGLNSEDTDPHQLRRIAIRHDTSLPVFIYKLWRARRNDR